MAIGQMGLDLETFLRLTPSEFQAVYDAFLEKQQTEYQNTWEIARWQVFRSVCPPDKKGMVSIYDFIRFGWDDNVTKKKEDPSTADRFENLANKWAEEDKQVKSDGNKL